MTAAEITPSIPGLETALVPGPVFFSMTLPGDPVAWARAGATIIFPRGGKPPFISYYTQANHKAYMTAIATVARARMRSKSPSEAPLTCLVIADLRVPKSWPIRDQAAALDGRLLPTSKPDDDNYAKIARDALNEIVYKDDAQVVDGRQIKRYSRSPALTIEVREFITP